MFPIHMNMNWTGEPNGALFTIAFVLMTLLNFGMAVFWIFVGWRAMKAHERLPEALAACLSKRAASPATDAIESDRHGDATRGL